MRPCADFEPETDDVLGAISLIFWSITLIVLLKYVCIVLNANDQGEGEQSVCRHETLVVKWYCSTTGSCASMKP